jgi:hypothetical protein
MNITATRTPARENISRLLLAISASHMRSVLSEALGEDVSHVSIERTLFSPSRVPVIHYRYQRAGDTAPRSLIAELVEGDARLHQQIELRRLGKARRGQVSHTAISPLFHAENPQLVLRHPGFDSNLLGLRLLHDKAFAANMLAKVIGENVASSQIKVTLKAHRLGKRAVLLVEGTSVSGNSHRIYARLRPTTYATGLDAYQKHASIAQHLQGAATVRIPTDLYFDVAWGAGFFEELPGVTPQFAGLEADATGRLAGQALAEWRALAPPSSRSWSADDELQGLNSWAVRLKEYLPDMLPAFLFAFHKVSNQLAALPAVKPSPCHRDFHEGQLLVHHDRCGILDFDTWCNADPALDIGNFLAHIRLWEMRTCTDAKQFESAFVTTASAGQSAGFCKRVATWKCVALLRLAAIYAFTSEPDSIVRGLLDEATA